MKTSGSGAAADTDLLMVHADLLEPVLDGALPSAEAMVEREPEGPQYLWDDSQGANELFAQGWGVVAPASAAGEELLGRIAPLIDHRRAQQDREVTIYRVPPRLDGVEAGRWRKDVFEAAAVRRRDQPRYLLVLGDLDQVSLELQTSLGSDGFVGRLAFDRPEDYEAYVDKLLRWEKHPAAITQSRAVFHTVRDRTSATTVGHTSLMEPGVALARRYRDEGDFSASQLVEVDHGYTPKPGPLVEEATKDEPGFLFTMSHGAGAPRRGWSSAEEQRRTQGGMSFGRSGGLLIGEALAGHMFMPGGVWFMMACFGAGTPAASKYERWLRQLGNAGHFSGDLGAVSASLPSDGRPFIAGVPKAVLASAEGPLAFIGHVDLAWTYSFRELDGERPVNRPNRFIDVWSGLLRHDRVGVAFHELMRHYGATNTDITALLEREAPDRERLGHLWMLRNDLAGYVLLGDPAARLPITPQPVEHRAVDPFAALGFAPSPAARARQAAPEPEPETAAPDVDPEVLERAIGLYLVGELGVRKILSECDLPLGRREFGDLVERYIEGGRRALGLARD